MAWNWLWESVERIISQLGREWSTWDVGFLTEMAVDTDTARTSLVSVPGGGGVTLT